MKFATIAAVLASAAATNQPLTDEFPTACASGDASACVDDQCCNFNDGAGNDEWRCMTSAQQSSYGSSYTDDLFSEFTISSCFGNNNGGGDGGDGNGSAKLAASLLAAASIAALNL